MDIIITRPLADGLALAPRLAALGHRPVLSPLLDIVVRPAMSLPSQDWQAIIITSANGARALARMRPDPALHQVPVFTVGEQSAMAARTAGFASVAAAGGDMPGLARHLCQTLDPGAGPLLYLSGAHTAGNFAALMMQAGFAVIHRILYDAVECQHLTPDAVTLVEKGEGAVLLYSPRTARIWCTLVAPLTVAAKLVHFCLSGNIAQVLPADYSRRIAAVSTEAALMDLIDGRH